MEETYCVITFPNSHTAMAAQKLLAECQIPIFMMPTLRELSGRLPAPEFHQWMMKRGLIDEKGVLTELAGDASIFLQ